MWSSSGPDGSAETGINAPDPPDCFTRTPDCFTPFRALQTPLRSSRAGHVADYGHETTPSNGRRARDVPGPGCIGQGRRELPGPRLRAPTDGSSCPAGRSALGDDGRGSDCRRRGKGEGWQGWRSAAGRGEWPTGALVSNRVRPRVDGGKTVVRHTEPAHDGRASWGVFDAHVSLGAGGTWLYTP